MECLYNFLIKGRHVWTLIAWPVAILLLYAYGFQQWRTLVAPTDDKCFAAFLAILIALTALCSASEIAISESTEKELQDWLANRQQKSKPKKLPSLSAGLLKFLYTHKKVPLINAVIVLANTIIVVVATVGTMGYLHDHTPPIPLHLGPMSLPMSGAAGFTTIGITILLFVFAETLPKQLAIYFHVRAVAALAWWIQLLMWLLIFPILALGIITPIKACIPDRE